MRRSAATSRSASRATKRRAGARSTGDRPAKARANGDPAAADPDTADPPQEQLAALGLDEAQGQALYAQVVRALEAGARPTKRRGHALAKARALGRHPAASAVEPAQLIPLILAVRDQLKAGASGGRPARAHLERLDRAADAALCGLCDPPASSRAPGREADLASTREILQRLIAVTPDAILTVRASGRLGQWNAAASRMTGRRRWEVQRRGLDALFREKDAFADIVAHLEERSRVSNREESVVNTSGDDVPVRIYGVRLKPQPRAATGKGRTRTEGDPDRFLLLLHDLSEVHHIRRRLIETEKLSAMAKIAGSVAHEFRNPLNSLFLSTDLLEDELEGHEAVREGIAPTLAAIREEIERLNQIITHYLALSKIAGSAPEVMDLGDVVTGFAEESLAHWSRDDVVLRTRSDEGHHRITADPSQVRRILVNLVENAVDAVTSVEVSEEKARKRGTITIALRRMRRSVKLTVKDNGPGIPEENRKRVFEPFFTSKAGGSGLGLYLVREIVLASGGTITLSSTEGRGTSVSVRWPFAEESTDAS